MKSKDIILSIAFFFQIAFGVLGNSFLISLFTFASLSGHRVRPIDAIVTQLALVNCLVLLSKGIPQTMAALGRLNFLGEVGCKMIFYLHKVSRDLSLSLTCLLSGFQALTISPNNSKWVELKTRTPKYLLCASLFCWTFHLLVCSYIPWGIKGPKQNRSHTEAQYNGYCSHDILSGFRVALITTFLPLIDVSFLSFMVTTSGYMVLLLYRHHKQVQQIHLSCPSPRTSPETRATKTILLLVSTFVCSYFFNCILATYMSLIKSPPWLMQTSAFLAASFPTISPYVLISSDSQVSRYFSALCGRKSNILA